MSKIVVNKIQAVGGTELTLPTADGTSGQTIQTDGSGNLSFASCNTACKASSTHLHTRLVEILAQVQLRKLCGQI